MSLAAKTLTAVTSNYIGTLVRVVAQFGAQLVIMRQLGPEPVGMFGYVTLAFGVLALFVDQGFGWSLIQSDWDEEEIKIVLSRLLLGSSLAAVLVYCLSWPAEYYLGGLAGSLFRWAAPSCVLIAVWGIAQARLRKDLQFGKIQIANTGAYIFATPVVGVTLALLGFGVWSLLAAWYVQSILMVAISYYYAPHSLKLGNPFKSTRAGALGRQVAGINIVNWSVDNVSGLTVGALGPSALGTFNAALMLSRTPAVQLAQTLQSVLFSAASALGQDAIRQRRLYLGALSVIALIATPAYGYGMTHSDFIIRMVFGAKWIDASGAFAAMTVGMVAVAMNALSGAMLTANGGQGAVLRSQVLCLVLMTVALLVANHFGLVGVGLAISLAYVIRLVYQMRAMAERIDIHAGAFVEVMRGPLLAACVMAIPLGALAPRSIPEAAAEGLALLGQTGAVLCLVALFPRWFLSDPLRDVMQRFGPGVRLLRLVDR
ncbi:oligosaccharide flippase family protein [Pseudoduganella buxea]|uniref:Lipopolysaccharide biosynthesis protein n=1 Tax=Pseudoduganella buxea TaxID=1949069 RepID=A0A6I3SUE7_9BURK|nr:oligosaccharide flippase family protein [Pseudoduganella buxea]MTV52659.1 oligosaccharide flippase family protein [Pseudoduganella buxea]GGC02734.1 lipopolysaccharide biosynthesis protein [Pseudoduganella buxea]